MDQMAALDEHLGRIVKSAQSIARICGDMQQTQLYERHYQAGGALPHVPARMIR